MAPGNALDRGEGGIMLYCPPPRVTRAHSDMRGQREPQG